MLANTVHLFNEMSEAEFNIALAKELAAINAETAKV